MRQMMRWQTCACKIRDGVVNEAGIGGAIAWNFYLVVNLYFRGYLIQQKKQDSI